ncbi:hypothetical protein Btru_015882 [Bulinus truncatus]|nr:hypothetical protein Btru_015882 [Bulinus truncatus]
MQTGTYKYAVRNIQVCRQEHTSMQSGTCKYAVRNIQVCSQEHPSMQSGTSKYAVRNIQVCSQKHPSMQSGTYKYAVRNIQVCRQEHTSMQSGTYKYAVRNIQVCRQEHTSMQSGTSKYADRNIQVCKQEHTSMQSGTSKYADRNMQVCSQEHPSMQTGTSKYAVRNIQVCSQEHPSMQTGTCKYADRNIQVCRQEHASMQSGTCKYADRNIQVCRQEHTSMQSGTSKYADRNMQVCRQEHPSMQTGTYKYAVRNIQVCRQEHTSMQSGTSKYADRNIQVCSQEHASMQTGTSKYADRNMQVCRQEHTSMQSGTSKYADKNIQVCSQEHPSMQIGTYKYAVRNMQVCRQEHASMQTGTCKYADRNIQVCRQEHPSMQTGTYKYAVRNIQVCSQEHPSMQTGKCKYAVKNIQVCRQEHTSMQSGTSNMDVAPNTVNFWGNAPDPDIRFAKSRFESELMKVQAVRTNEVQLNPLLLSTRLGGLRARASFKYSRVHPPQREAKKNTVIECYKESIPLRQLSHPSRRGPRDCVLPNLIKHPVQVRLHPLPLTDIQFHERRAEANERLNQLLANWAVYNRIAYPVPLSRQSMLSDLDPKRKISRGTFIRLTRGSARRKESMVSQLSSGSGKKTTSFAVPQSLKKRNRWKFFTREALNHIKASKMLLPDELSKSDLRIYVSTTPDLQEEREFLEEVAYPKIRDLCEHMGLNCHVVDMRTGAGTLTNDIETFDLIEKELQICRSQSIGPYFICLIGHELDDKNLPGFLHKAVFEEIREVLIKENISGVEALDDVYRLDSNHIPPIYTKQRIKSVEEYQSPEDVERILHEALVTAVSTIRKHKQKEEMGQMDTYRWSAVVKEVEEGLLTNHSPRTDTLCLLLDYDVRDEAPGTESIDRLRHNIVTYYRQYASRDNLIHVKSAKKTMTYLRYISDTFISGVTSLLKSQVRSCHYDLMHELTDSSEALQHVRIYLNASSVSIEGQLGQKYSASTSEADSSSYKVTNERNGNGVVDVEETQSEADDLVDNVRSSMVSGKNATQSEADDLVDNVRSSMVSGQNATQSEADDLVDNVRSSTDTGQSVAVFEDIKQVLHKQDSSPKTLLLWGQKGSGKTTVAAHVARAAVQWQPRRKVVVRRLGTTLRSFSLFRFLESLIRQLNFLYSLELVLPIDITLQEMVNVFCQTLRDVSDKTHTDGGLLLILDQVESICHLSPHIVTSILDSLSDGLTLMLVLNVPSPLFEVIRSHPTAVSFTRPYLSQDEFSEFLTKSLANVCRVITGDQLTCCLNALPGDITPVCSQTIFHIVRWWPSHTLPSLKSFLGEPDLDFDVLLQSVESELGTAFTRYSLSLLASACHGLTDHELLHLVSTDSDLLSEIKNEEEDIVSVVEGFPYQLQLSRLITRLNHFVLDVKIEGETVHILSTSELAKTIAARYMNGDFFHVIHQKLANFFLFIRRGLLLSSRDIVEQKHKDLSKYHWRTMRCVTFHLTHSSVDPLMAWKSLKEKVFFNFNWLVNEVYSGFFPELLDDIRYALDTIGLDPEIMSLQRLLLSVRHTAIYNPVSLAAVFSSLTTTDQANEQDSINTVIHQATLWLQQVHLQTLVPVAYNPDKSSRLLLKENCLYGVTNIQIIPGSENLLIQRLNSLAILNTLTREEVVLGTFNSQISASNIVSDTDLIVLTSDKSDHSFIEIFNLQKGKIERTHSLGDASVQWFHVVHSRAAYYATRDGVQSIDLETGKIKTIFSGSVSWKALCIVGSKNEKLFILKDDGRMESTSVRGVAESRSVSLKQDDPNEHSPPLVATKDGKYIVYTAQRQATVVQCQSLKVVSNYSHNSLPIVNTGLSRSHEHLFLAYTSGDVTCHVLSSGTLVFQAKLRPSLKAQSANGVSRRHGRSGNAKRLRKNETVETITSLQTSEDDHFLFCGTNVGQVHVFHIPTGLHVVDICSRQAEIVQMTFLTDRTHFQHLITTDKMAVSKHWNLRPLFKHARLLLHGFISDEDLKKEEGNKIELNNYMHIYQDNITNRIFLNGPDITAFYSRPPETLFDPLDQLDPDFGQKNDWEITGTLADVAEDVVAITCGHQLSDVALTLSNDFRLARWSLHDGTLVWSKKLGGQDSQLHNLVSVYYDQAVLMEYNSRSGEGISLSVIYTGEGQNKMISRDNLVHYWLSRDRAHVLLLCQASGRSKAHTLTEMNLFIWDLINVKETRHHLTKPHTPDTGVCVVFSPQLTQCVTADMTTSVKLFNDDICSVTAARNVHEPQNSDSDNFEGFHGDVEAADSHLKMGLEMNTERDRFNRWPPLEIHDRKIRQYKTALKHHSPEPSLVEGHCQLYWTRLANDDQSTDTARSGRGRHSAYTGHGVRDKINNLILTEENTDIENHTDCFEITLSIKVTSLCFVGEDNLFLGTSSGHVFMLNLPILQTVCLLTKTGPRYVDTLSDKIIKDFISPHKHWICGTKTSEDTSTLISLDKRTVCVWNARNRSLIMSIELSSQEKISHVEVSKDAAIIALVADKQILHLYTPLEKREIVSYRTTFDILTLQMTCDCRKILLKGQDPDGKPILEIFDVKNVDDILMKIAGRKISQQNEVRENLNNERLRKTS